MENILYAAAPVLVHLFLSETVGYLLAGRVSALLIAGLTSVIALPVGMLMFRRDRIKPGAERTVLLIPKTVENSNRVLPLFLVECLICAAAGAALNFLWSYVIDLSRLPLHFPDRVQTELLQGSLSGKLLILAVLVPVSEELFFRGLFYERMRRYASAPFAVIACSFLFAFYHGNVLQILFAIPMALVMCCLEEKKSCLLFPVLFHCGSNLAAVLWKL